MPRRHNRAHKLCLTPTASTPEGELERHLKDLGLPSVETYRAWCKQHGLGSAIHKSWQERREEKQLAKKLAEASSAQSELLQHIVALGLPDLENYEMWCRQHGFPTGGRKNPQQKRQEWLTAQREQAQSTLQTTKQQTRKPDAIIQALFAGTLDPATLKNPSLYKIGEVFASENDPDVRDAYRRLLLHAQTVGNLLSVHPVIAHYGPQPGNTYIEALHALAVFHLHWLRRPEAWKPDSHSARRQFESLARHLLTNYPVPAFLDAAWFREPSPVARQQQEWFRHIGIGQNIRTAGLPLCLTSKAAHFFLQAPRDLPIEAALRWGQLRAMGASDALIRAVLASRLGATFEDEAFWQSVLHFFINNPLLDTDYVGPIVDYVYHRKYVPQALAGPDGVVIRRPNEPDFTMKGRSAVVLIGLVEQWHRQIAKETVKAPLEWKPSGIQGLQVEKTDEETGSRVYWLLEEILNSKDLRAEGKAMSHCVATHERACVRGQTSIWSLQVEYCDTQVRRRVMTIAVNNKSRNVTEARGRCNKMPGARQISPWLAKAPPLLRRWAAQEGLSIPPYI